MSQAVDTARDAFQPTPLDHAGEGAPTYAGFFSEPSRQEAVVFHGEVEQRVQPSLRHVKMLP
jgi:hypothetical protein